MFTIHLECDMFIGLGVRWISHEYWRGLVIHLPSITIMLTRPRIEESEEGEDERESNT